MEKHFYTNALPQVDIGIIANIQRAGFTADARIGANNGIIQHNIKQVGIGTNNGIFDDG